MRNLKVLYYLYYSGVCFLCIWSNLTDAHWTAESGSRQAPVTQKDFPSISCPRDTFPLIVQGQVKECQPGNASFSCPEGFICYFDGIDSRYICCGKSSGYCEGGRPYLDPVTYEPQKCKLGSSKNCKDPFECATRDANSSDGYCCLNLSSIEPPPVGCPWGTRPLRDASKKLLPCTPGMANVCPGNTICYFDSVERTYRCCGRDPGEGCPTGTRAIKLNNQIVPCLPGDPKNDCPGKAVCQWSYLIDRFQCCEADDGCPQDSSPYFEPGATQSIRACLPQYQPVNSQIGRPPSACPANFKCEFNFWTTSYQCCGKKSGLCPPGQVAYIDANTNVARTCAVGQTTCPPGYTCQASTTGQAICCGTAGQCPSGSTRYTDSSGRYHSCTPSIADSCLRPAACQPAIGGPQGQFLCCITAPISSDGQCPLGYVMQNDLYTPCNPSSPVACISGAMCMPSASQSSVFLCCKPFPGEPLSDDQLCPIGSRPLSGMPFPCSPLAAESCSPGGQCLQSPSRPYAFYCCAPSRSEVSQCPPNHSVQNGRLIQCSPSAPICKPNAACLQSPSNPSLFLCCVPTLVSSCPVGYSPQNGLVTPCSPSTPRTCAFGASCLHSSTNPGTYLCCAAVGAVEDQQCPSGLTRQDGHVIQCDPVTFQPCNRRDLCLLSIGPSASTYICCSGASAAPWSFLQCPVNYVRQDDTAIQCNPQNANLRCSSAATCVASTDHPSVYICCAASTSIAQCPVGYSPQNNAVTHCSPSFPTCIAGSQCLPSVGNPSLFLCCTPATLNCPMGFSLLSPSPQICNPQDGALACPLNTKCVPSQQSGIYICCRPMALSGKLLCPGNGQSLMSGSAVTYCSPDEAQSHCPSSYSCQPAVNAPGVALCCSSGGLPPTCPGGGVPVPMASAPGHYRFCSPNSPACPVDAMCEPATNMLNSYVCCAPSGTSTAYACPRDYTPLVDPTGLITFCSTGNGACPAPSTCLQAVNNPLFFICCQPFGQSAAQCPLPGSLPLYIAGVIQTCSGPSVACPQIGYTCEQSSTNGQHICCSVSPSGGAQCANGHQVYQPGSITFFCNPSLDQCPNQYECLPSTLPGQNVCCAGASTRISWQCASGSPFPNPQTPQTCGPSSFSCPDGTSCEPSTTSNQLICCNISGAQAMCPADSTPHMDGSAPRPCTGPSDLSCPAPFTCAPSDQPNIYICCHLPSATALSPIRCFSGAPAYVEPGSTQPQPCTLASQNCPAGFSCQASSTLGITVCCGAVQPNAFFCPDGTPALIHGTTGQTIICSEPDVVCPGAFACIPTPSSPDVRICCPGMSTSVRSGADVAASPDVCGPGQQPQLMDNNPQACRIGKQQPCADGFICQRGPTEVYYCCQGLRCPSGVTLLDTEGHPRYCNPASISCPPGSTCHQAVNLPGNYICCMTSASHRSALARCIGRGTHMLPDGRPQMCSDTGPNVCPRGRECSSFTTTNDTICCSTTSSWAAEAATPMCPEGDPYRDVVTKQYHYCSDTNYACPEGFVCKRAVNNPGHYVCCSGRSTCQKGWIPYLDAGTRSPMQCSPYDYNACRQAGPVYKCQQSTKPGEYLCCMESMAAVRSLFLDEAVPTNETKQEKIYTRPAEAQSTGLRNG